MKRLRTKRHSLRTDAPSALNNPARWDNYLRPWFNVEAYQKLINDRVGLNRDGRPIVRLVWAQDVTQHVFFEETPRYWLRRRKAGSQTTWWTVPRFVFEKRIEPEQYVTAWNATRYSLTDPTTGLGHKCDDCGSTREPKLIAGKVYCSNCAGTNISGGEVIDKGPPPDEMWQFFSECAVHEEMVDRINGWPLCCARKFYEDRGRCWGQFRLPNTFDLQVIEQSVAVMNAQKFRDPYAPLSAQQLAEAELAANKQVERADMQMEALEQEIIRDFIRTHGHRLTETDPGVLRHGKYHDVGQSMQKGEQSGNIILTDS